MATSNKVVVSVHSYVQYLIDESPGLGMYILTYLRVSVGSTIKFQLMPVAASHSSPDLSEQIVTTDF